MNGRLQNDCFALPQGVNWTPVRDALDELRSRLSCVCEIEHVPLDAALDRVVAAPIMAPRAHPPFANSAIDGYGFKHGSGRPETGLRLLEGRAAAGQPFSGRVPEGAAIRILTGAPIPDGVDAVVLQEDVVLDSGIVRFDVKLKPGANIRPAGEDIAKADMLLDTGRRITSGDMAMLASVGVNALPVFCRLRVGLLSTGNELASQEAASHQIFDANRPMLTSIVRKWGYEVVDLGQAPDDRKALTAMLDEGAEKADVIITTGGASAGDEDHISASLKEAGTLATWRIAVKPGRPLALGVWQGTPLFGLPGNPVAAFVCALVFVRPSLLVLSGQDWKEPDPTPLTARFSKNKKIGRAEFLRACRDGDHVDAFKSEGSGRVTGLSWADGLVRLAHDQGPIEAGDRVDYFAFSQFGI